MSRLTDFSAGQSEIIESTANKLNEETSCEIESLKSQERLLRELKGKGNIRHSKIKKLFQEKLLEKLKNDLKEREKKILTD